MSNDPSYTEETQAFLQSLPELAPEQSFQFACHPGVSCFNACCADLNMPLTPYDVLRLRRELKMDSENFLEKFTIMGQYPHSGFPLFFLKMNNSSQRECPFVSPAGCTVYANRSAACRTYPLGRATHEDAEGKTVEQYVVVQEAHCTGFMENASWTSHEWLKDQGLEPYNAYNDRYMHLMAQQIKTGRTLAPKHMGLCMLAFYQLDRFAEYIRSKNLFAQCTVPPQIQEQILEDEEARLGFAFDWIAHVLFDEHGSLVKKG